MPEDTLRRATAEAARAALLGFQQQEDSTQQLEAESENQEDITPGGLDSESEPEAESTPSKDQQVTDEDVPTEYFGVDLSDVPPEQREQIIARFQESDQYINRILREKAMLEQQRQHQPAPQEPQPKQELSDEELIRELGLREDDPYFEVKRDVMVPFGRLFLQQQEALTQVVEEMQAQRALDHWNRELDRLETDHGKIPQVSRDDIINFAAEQGIGDPEAAFLKLWAPAQRLVQQEVTKVQQQVAPQLRQRKQEATGLRPRTGPTTEPKEVKATNMRDAILEAAKIAEQKLGYTWADAVRAEGIEPEE